MQFIIDGVEFHKFAITTKPLMEHYLSELGNELEVDISDYTFAANYIWLENASGFYAIIEDSFCLFSMAGSELSMLLPPLGKLCNLKKAIEKCFNAMNENNTKTHYARIDYVAGSILEKFAAQIENGASIFDAFEEYIFEKQLVDYIYKSDDLIELKGNSYHTKRTEINKFKNTYPNFKIETLDPKAHREIIIDLANKWAAERIKYMPAEKMDDFLEGIYQEKAAIKRMLDHYEKLELIGIVLFIDDEIKGFSVGEKINDGVASVIIEKTDFATLGSAQFIFREFSKVLKNIYNCDFINVGDDMGFENLKKVKMSYRPNHLEIKYSIYQKQ
ncbi:DUF2156 domain-containing protein [Campylobacter fetus]|uniref:DUF2156 domain-containing protein n=3 Tax=Campylobacter fetus TaxID=196 RepID=A0A5L8UC20_CAMFE|nr:phosphatidylglycerol lysyltransferase domain-containing protein [Campylobacter fetus]OCS21472.1 ribonuclease HII [Campylobacter fetus subsp. venerealis cfvi97/532]OCS25254.1 ribonuclease HII [Campylobacter fetus subsp. venerealis cfvB10]OCS29794.1 ribonuclease HII [Campylobacter fetus subsp. venerealis LMG 6570 = CCUG 33900]OCS39997.1 ribonuclease HII [Campylobacter fetus subsp. venerealis cfvi02/298]ABK83118.1 conserved hypothetical protein [Campylobacter fetus subsp. fetus 82-40]